MKTIPATNLREVLDCGGKSDATPLWVRATLLEISDTSARAKAPSRPTCRRTPKRCRVFLRPWLLFALLLGAVGLAAGAGAATLTVTNLADNGPGTLRQAIADTGPGDTIDFAVTGNIVLTNELVISTNLIINGPGATNLMVSVSLDPDVYSRILNVTGGTNIVSGLTLAYGYPNISENGGAILNASTLTIINCLLATNVSPGAAGGAIYNSGTLSVSNSAFSGNTGVSGGGIENIGLAAITMSGFSGNSTDADGDGAAIENGGTMDLSDSSVSGNIAHAGNGGGINNEGTLTVSNCSFSSNQALSNPGQGGAILNGGICTVTDCIFSSNYALAGGTIANNGTFALNRSTLRMNIGYNGGGGVFNSGPSFTAIQSTISENNQPGDGDGGGLYIESGSVALTNCTISENVGHSGGGVQNIGGNVILESCDVVYNLGGIGGGGLLNAGGTVRVQNSILARNTKEVSGFIYTNSDLTGVFISDGYNLVETVDGSTGLTNGVAHDLVGSNDSPIDPKIGPLQDNGGPTWTHALLPGSPALDAGDSGGLSTDQRGGARAVLSTTNTPPQGSDGSDIGAFEAGGFVRLISITRTNSTAHLQFTKDATTAPTNVYHLQRRAAFGPGDWADLPGLIGDTNTLVPFLDPTATNAQNFYRVRVGP